MDTSRKRLKPSEETSIGEGEEIEKDEAAVEKKMARVWSEEDEIVLLQGMIDHINVTSKCPMKDVDAFLQSISIDLTLREFRDKFRSINIKSKRFGARMIRARERAAERARERASRKPTRKSTRLAERRANDGNKEA